MDIRVIATIAVYVASMVAVYHLRPDLVFDERGEVRPFGTSDPDGTLLSFGVLAVALAFASFFVVSLAVVFGRVARRIGIRKV